MLLRLKSKEFIEEVRAFSIAYGNNFSTGFPPRLWLLRRPTDYIHVVVRENDDSGAPHPSPLTIYIPTPSTLATMENIAPV